MLHMVQIVFSGTAEKPKLFFDQAAAEAAYVAYVTEYWAQSYPAYCDRQGIDHDSFFAAQAFLKSLDLTDKSRVNYWTVTPEEVGGDAGKLWLLCPEAGKEQRAQIQGFVDNLQQATLTIQEKFTGLADTVAALSDYLNGAEAAILEPATGGDTAALSGPSTAPSPEEPQETDAKYATPEWKKYVDSFKIVCGGNRSEFPFFSRQDWRQDVYSNATSLEYWDWVTIRIDACIRKAELAGYSLVQSPDEPGHYTFKTPDGIVHEVSFDTKEEAWCHATLHAEGDI